MRQQRAEQLQDISAEWRQDEERFESEAMSDDDRLLTEIDHLNANRLPDGSHSPWVKEEQLKNLITAVQEAGMPYAVSKTRHPYKEAAEHNEQGEEVGAFMWLGKTAVQNAMSGYRYHRHESALRRVDIEVEEARNSANLTPGMTKIFISPRMTREDAAYKEAKEEHLADEDSVRIAEPVLDEQGNVQERALESLLFRDIPLKAWVGMLNDPDNELFGRSIGVEDNGSALPVMEAHAELEVASDKLPNGVVSVVEAVIPYIDDPELQANARGQLKEFYKDQETMQAKAENIARRWQQFEIDLADSVEDQRAKPGIRSFINSMQSEWNDDDLAVILEHQLPEAQYRMSRELAAILEGAKQNLLWTRAGVVAGNEKVLKQMGANTAKKLYRDEMFIQVASENQSYGKVLALEAQTDRTIATHNFVVGGGCSGESKGKFKGGGGGGRGVDEYGNEQFDDEESKIGEVSIGKCVVESCPTRPGTVKVGGCGVCLERCQKLFDQGKDPTKMKAAGKRAGAMVVQPAKSQAKNREFALAA
jgi:hypothetical protein